MKKDKIFTILRVAVSVGIIGFFLVYQRETLATFVATIKKANLGLFAIGILGYLPVICLSILRWNALLKVQGVNLPIGTLIRLFFIGSFFNNFTLGVTGGDVVKAYYVAKETHHQKAEVVLTVFLDRVVGIFALFFIAIVALFFTRDQPQLEALRPIILWLFIGAIIGGFILFNKNLLKKIPKLEETLKKLPFYHSGRKIYNAFHLYHRHKRVLLLTFILSALLQSIMILVVCILGDALGLQNTQIKHYFLFFPIIATVSALPISLGGLGVGEAAFVTLFALIGVPAGKAFALGLCTRFVWIIWGLVGGVLYMLPSNKIKKVELEKEVEKEAETFTEKIS